MSNEYRVLERMLVEGQISRQDFARESVLTEDLHIRKQVLTKRLQRHRCLHIKKLSSLYLTLL